MFIRVTFEFSSLIPLSKADISINICMNKLYFYQSFIEATSNSVPRQARHILDLQEDLSCFHLRLFVMAGFICDIYLCQTSTKFHPIWSKGISFCVVTQLKFRLLKAI